MPEIEKALAELKRLVDYRVTCAETEEGKEKERNFFGLGLTSRKNLCIHPEASTHDSLLGLLSSILSKIDTLLGVQRKERQNSGRQMSGPHKFSCLSKRPS